MNAARTARAIAEEALATRPLNAAAIHAISRAHAKALGEENGRAVLDIAIALSGHERLGVRLIAFLLVLRHKDAMAAVRGKDLIALAERLSDWSDVDTFSLVSGRAWREGQVSDAFFRKWAGARNRWLRRAAVVSTVALNMRSQGGEGDAPRTLAMCDLLAEDRDDMVVKAVSWALRALATRDRKAVRAFLATHHERLAKRVLREVGNKLDTGLKNPRRERAVAPARRAKAYAGRRGRSD